MHISVYIINCYQILKITELPTDRHDKIEFRLSRLLYQLRLFFAFYLNVLIYLIVLEVMR